MADIFNFKQFSVNQTGCAMKVNTDGVLLGALAMQDGVKKLLDIGTGTGVIALMLAQRFPEANVDAVELDAVAAKTAHENFLASPFADRLQRYNQSFQEFFTANSESRYDLIVSNPPFYIQSLQSPGAAKALAKHADELFFEQLMANCAKHLTPEGSLWLILPLATALLVKQLALNFALNLQQSVDLQSYPQSAPHRQILAFSLHQTEITERSLVIYNAPKVYSSVYQTLLKDFLTIF